MHKLRCARLLLQLSWLCCCPAAGAACLGKCAGALSAILSDWDLTREGGRAGIRMGCRCSSAALVQPDVLPAMTGLLLAVRRAAGMCSALCCWEPGAAVQVPWTPAYILRLRLLDSETTKHVAPRITHHEAVSERTVCVGA